METEIMSNSLLKECHSGPLILSNCRKKGQWKFPMVSQLEIKFELYTRYKFDTTQVNGLNLFDCPGFNSKLYLRQNSTVIPPGCGQHGIWGKWNFQKDSMYFQMALAKIRSNLQMIELEELSGKK